VNAFAALVEERDRDRFDAARLAPPAVRERLHALYAINLEAARVPFAVREPIMGKMRLRWLLDRIDDVFSDNHSQGAPEALYVLRRDFQNPAFLAAQLKQSVEARADALSPGPFSKDQLHAFIEMTAGTLSVAAASLCMGKPPGQWSPIVHDFGFAFGAAQVLAATALLAAHGKVFLACSESAANALRSGRIDENAIAAAQELASEALLRLTRARLSRKNLPRAVAPAILAGWRSERILSRAKRSTANILQDFASESEFRRRFSLWWRSTTGKW
jgi:phytoene/squalene synthetase